LHAPGGGHLARRGSGMPEKEPQQMARPDPEFVGEVAD
jgi:hypothetical protein